MSLNSLATSSVARDLSKGSHPRKLSVASDDAVGPKELDVQNALSALVEYVPAETITLYLATLAALPVLRGALPGLTAPLVYGFFGAATPLLFGIIYAGKRRATGQDRWPGYTVWPWWPMTAATIAFLAWGIAVPDGPILTSDAGGVLGGFIAVGASTILGVFGRFFAPKPS